MDWHCWFFRLEFSVWTGVDDKAWLPIPFTSISFQPSELLKISFIITFAYHLSKVKDQLNRPKQLLLLCIHGAIPCGLIHLQGDDGTVLVMAVIFASMLFVAGLSWKYIVPVLVMIPPAAVVLWNAFLDDDKKNRILAIIRPELVDSAITWQQDRGLISIWERWTLGKRNLYGDRTVPLCSGGI